MPDTARALDEATSAARPRRGRPAGTNASRAVLDAAKRLFLEDGFEGVTLERVGEAAGVTRQTVYNRFGGKEALFRAVVERHWASISEECAAVFSDDFDSAAAPAAVLRRFAGAILRFIDDTDQVAFTRLVIAESRRLPWIAEEFYSLGKEPLLRAFAARLARLTERGLLRCARPELAARQFMGLVQEFVVWPRVMAIGPAALELPAAELVIEEAILMFLGRYGTAAPSRGDAASF